MARHRTGFDGERHTAHVGLDLTPSQRAELDQRAARAGLLRSEYMRAAIFAQRMPSAPINDPAAVRELAAELARVGNNLNQIARVVNTTGDVRSDHDLQRVLDQLAAAMTRVIAL